MTFSTLNTNKLLPQYVNNGLTNLGNWANVTAVTGTPTTGTYTDSTGTYKYWQWTGAGSITTTLGAIDTLVVGGGPGRNTNLTYSGSSTAGALATRGIIIASATTHTISVGGAGGNSSAALTVNESRGGGSSLGSLASVAASSPENPSNDRQFNSSITGTSVLYCPSSNNAYYGGGGNSSSGGSGVVIVRVPLVSALI